MVREVRDIEYTYKGQSTTIHKVSGDYCDACDESLHSPAEAERINEAMLTLVKEVNASVVDPAFIVATRKKLKLDQREASKIFGGGPNGFSRYENGKTRPPLALIQLLRLLNNHPELLSELRDSGQAAKKVDSRARVKRKNTMYA